MNNQQEDKGQQENLNNYNQHIISEAAYPSLEVLQNSGTESSKIKVQVPLQLQFQE